ncbi:hypothetical protein AciM339_1238 [Aciduliprofundum sp. MAR08-339]|uniref:endonuclease dU n=1 Tax=Aciduliprofundum sp. (strain MAR08-339) TaxID=673860 RepID=UPI0002A4C3F4|nr:hypothetical protein AciM339_1238 [Aciduliprofundum sp. MAR08-339]
MKKHIRALGIDDSYFVPHIPGEVDLIGVVLRAPNYLEGMLRRKIGVDALDSTDSIIDMLNSKYGRQIKVVFLQGITFGGFNIVDIERIWREREVPVIVISRKNPDLRAIEYALRKHFEDWEYRMNLLRKHKIEMIQNGEFEIYVQRAGISMDEARRVISSFTLRGAIPEPLRVAHLIASALHFGESKGKP